MCLEAGAASWRRRKQNFQNSCVVRRNAGAGKNFQLNPFGERAPARAGGPRGGRGFRAGPGRVQPRDIGSMHIMAVIHAEPT